MKTSLFWRLFGVLLLFCSVSSVLATEYLDNDIDGNYSAAVKSCYNAKMFQDVYDINKFRGTRKVKKSEAIKMWDNLYGVELTNRIFTAKERASSKKVTYKWTVKFLRLVVNLAGQRLWICEAPKPDAKITRYEFTQLMSEVIAVPGLEPMIRVRPNFLSTPALTLQHHW